MNVDCRPLIAEMLQYQKTIWDNNQFCKCSADSLKQCKCSSEKRNDFLQRRKQKLNEKFSEDIDEALLAITKSDENKVIEDDIEKGGLRNE